MGGMGVLLIVGGFFVVAGHFGFRVDAQLHDVGGVLHRLAEAIRISTAAVARAGPARW